MRVSGSVFKRILIGGLIPVAFGAVLVSPHAQSPNSARPTIATEADFERAMKELSNWGRWGDTDELGAANLITPAKRKQALALVREGAPISLAHDIVQENAVDATTILQRVVVNVSPGVAVDQLQYSGTYHGVIHSHLDSVDCHMMVDGKGYNGVSMDEIKATGGCPRGGINALKDGVVTRGVLFDATRLPGKATPQGWLEPGTAIHREDLEALEKIERVKVSPGDVILLYTGRWKRRAARGPWPNAEGFAGYHVDVAYFLKERGVSFIGADGPNDVSPSGSARCGASSAGARRHGRQHFRQPGFRARRRAGAAAEPLRIPVHGRAAAYRKRDGVAAQPACDFLKSRERRRFLFDSPVQRNISTFRRLIDSESPIKRRG